MPFTCRDCRISPRLFLPCLSVVTDSRGPSAPFALVAARRQFRGNGRLLGRVRLVQTVQLGHTQCLFKMVQRALSLR